MNRRTFLTLPTLALPGAPGMQPPRKYEANWTSLDTRPMPEWFNEAKFGIFVVWGIYSVPAWVDSGYAEWYGKRAEDRNSATGKFHVKHYGENFKYEDFAPMFKAELWDPDAWADLFARSGAKYVVTTSKYHDGFCLWPCESARTVNTDRWNAMVAGPKRDLLGELNEAGRKRGLRMGIYYSLYEWWHPLWLTDRERFATEHMHGNFKEVVTKYKPPVIFLDGEWEMDDKRWHTGELAGWLYNESPVKDYVAVNDRWGAGCRSVHGDYYSSEYGGGEYPPTHPWQEDRGIGKSYGYNRNESIHDYDSPETLIRMLSTVCGNGGNLLLDVGPTADGRIPVIMQERLLQIGEWLKAHGEAIYGSQASPFWPRRIPWGTCTYKPGRIFVHLHEPERSSINLRGVRNRIERIYLLSDRDKKPLRTSTIPGGIRIELPPCGLDKAVTVIVLEIRGEPDVDKTTEQDDDGTVYLHCYAMKTHGVKTKVQFQGWDRIVHIGDWSDPGEWVSVEFDLMEAGAFDVEVTYSSDAKSAGSRFKVVLGGQQLAGETRDTGGWNKYKTEPIGRMTVGKAGRHKLEVRAEAAGWKTLALKAVTLKPKRG